ncbi:MAG: hypothetical protein KM312_02430 [Hydrogenibacillus schlegelii]|uniref:Uncharacterized protein n=1 Tax=Hydrogenibacillus schlegelii TaxID=1484 RepID=A0A947G8L8_HYDSH|nr:hypothetical protein [Hydrogenibacillus schlegelii]
MERSRADRWLAGLGAIFLFLGSSTGLMVAVLSFRRMLARKRRAAGKTPARPSPERAAAAAGEAPARAASVLASPAAGSVRRACSFRGAA